MLRLSADVANFQHKASPRKRLMRISPQIGDFLNDHGLTLTGDQLGEGSYAVVEKATWKGIPCAVKVSKQSIEESENTRKELERGPSIWTRTREHPGLVTNVHFFSVPVATEDGRRSHVATVWELGTGSLEDEIGKIKPDALIRLLHSVAGAIDFLNQEHRIFHRDVKAPNILRFAGGDARLADLGTARTVIDPQSPAATIVGTPGFGPPELIGHGECHPTCDLYGLASTYVVMLTGQFPIGGRWPALPTAPPALLDRLRSADEISAQLAGNGFEGRELKLLLAALEPDATKRFAGGAMRWLNEMKEVVGRPSDNVATTIAAEPFASEADDDLLTRAAKLGLNEAVFRELVIKSIGIENGIVPLRLHRSLNIVGAYRAKELAHELKKAISELRHAVQRMREKLERRETSDKENFLVNYEYSEVLHQKHLLRIRLDGDCASWKEYHQLVVPIYNSLDEFGGDFLNINDGYIPKWLREPDSPFPSSPPLETFADKVKYYNRTIDKLLQECPEWEKECGRFYADHCELLGS